MGGSIGHEEWMEWAASHRPAKDSVHTATFLDHSRSSRLAQVDRTGRHGATEAAWMDGGEW